MRYMQVFLNIFFRIASKISFLRVAIAHMARFQAVRKLPFIKQLYDDRMRFIMQKNIIPELVIIENTNACNARCILCPQNKMKRQKGVMDLDLYRKIIDDCALLGIRRVQLNATGEPLLDKDFVRRIIYAKEKGIQETSFFTNGFLLDDAMVSAILEAAPSICVISFDSYNKDAYEKITGLPFEVVKRNALNFLGRNRDAGGRIYTIVSTILLYDSLKGAKRNPLYRQFRKLADKAAIIPKEMAHNWAGAVDNSELGKDKKRILRVPCRRLWSSFNILWDGRVSLCDMDYEGEEILGDMRTQLIKEVWDGPVYRKYREAHLRKNYGLIRLCRDCVEDVSWWKEHAEDPRRL